MKRAGRITQFTMVAAIVATTGLMFLEFRQRDIDSEGLHAFRQENLVWNGTQLRFELMRFIAALDRYGHDRDPALGEEAVRRFDVLWSRSTIFQAGKVGARLRSVDGAAVVGAMDALLSRHEAVLMDLDAAADATLAAVAADFEALLPDTQAYVAHIANFEEARMAEVQMAIIESNRIGLWKGVFTTLVAFSLFAAALGLVRADRRRLESQEALTAEAQQAAAAKRRFLTMMSHELRTPMNGVIGMLALIERTALDDRQRTLVDVARRSSVEMLGLVEDILDLSDLQSGAVAPEPNEVSLARLAEMIADLTARRLCRPDHGVEVGVDGDPETVLWIADDLAAKIARQIIIFFLERLALKSLTCRLSFSDSALEIAVSAPMAGGRGWDVGTFQGPLTATGADIQTEAIGPAVAAGLLNFLHGAVETDVGADGRLRVSARIPAAALPRLRPGRPSPPGDDAPAAWRAVG